MIHIFVETNFLLNLTLKQESYLNSYKILKLAEGNKIKLYIPSLSISEAYFAFFKQKQDQRKVRNELNDFIVQALKSSHSKAEVGAYKDVPIIIEKKLDKELTMLDSNILRVLK